ncbi:hypothetical protein PLICRDRAFT_123998 [Plicaturopsis crispa FD-325 SS-3]|nr:hypothetical protein PLICRDRAFT_123998 [Plicaturopsis crispa FD-325 SS-3]
MNPPYFPPPSPSSTMEDELSSGISEVDSLSDSDWLDISGGRDSDNDSLGARDSDRDYADFEPRSRRSSTSNASSNNGEVEAWEGLVDDSGVDALPIGDISPIALTPAADGSLDPATDLSLAPQTDPAEEQRVKNALDQSMISTLSSSRSSGAGATTSVHTSSRDLRLSFPDPLTSSRDQLVAQESTSTDVSDASVSDTDDDADDDDDVPEVTVFAEDLGPISTPMISDAVLEGATFPQSELDIFLYGPPSTGVEWSLIEKILHKAAAGAGLTVVPAVASGAARVLRVEGKTRTPTSFPSVVAVIDRTSADNRQLDSCVDVLSNRPSLAVVFLPSFPHISARDHTFFLPMLLPSGAPSGTDDLAEEKALVYDDAEMSWDFLRIPRKKTLLLKDHAESPIVDAEDIEKLDPARAYLALETLVQSKRKPVKALIKEQLTPSYLVTLLALLSVIMGFVVNISVRPTATSTPPPTSTLVRRPSTSSSVALWQRIRPLANHSTLDRSPTAEANMAVIPSSLKDFAVAVFNPPSLATLSPAAPRVAPSQMPAHDEQPSDAPASEKVMSWSERVQSTKDIILRPVPSSLSAIDVQSKAVSLFTHSRAVRAAERASLKLPDALAEIRTLVAQALGLDVADIVDAIDELIRVIANQAAAIMQQSKGKARDLRGALGDRHSRAQERAREIKEMGSQLIAFATERIRDRTSVARDNARAVKESVVNLEALAEYSGRLGDAVGSRIRQSKGSRSGQIRSRRNRAKRDNGRRSRKSSLGWA